MWPAKVRYTYTDHVGDGDARPRPDPRSQDTSGRGVDAGTANVLSLGPYEQVRGEGEARHAVHDLGGLGAHDGVTSKQKGRRRQRRSTMPLASSRGCDLSGACTFSPFQALDGVEEKRVFPPTNSGATMQAAVRVTDCSRSGQRDTFSKGVDQRPKRDASRRDSCCRQLSCRQLMAPNKT